LDKLHQNLASQKLINAGAYEISIRDFANKVLEAFYRAVGNEKSDPLVQALWLRSRGAESFYQDPKEKFVEVFKT